MSNALAVYHGRFGRVTLYHLDRPMAMHAHREGHLIFHVEGGEASIKICDSDHPLTARFGAAVNPWQPHNFQPSPGARGALFLVLYIKPAWFLEAGRSAKSALRFGRNGIEITDQIGRLIYRVANLLLEDMFNPLFTGYLYELTHECFDQSWQWVPEGAPICMPTDASGISGCATRSASWQAVSETGSLSTGSPAMSACRDRISTSCSASTSG
jgi:hypothetical protein